MSAEIQRVMDQENEILDTTTFGKYEKLVNRHFLRDPFSTAWLSDVKEYADQNPDLKNNPDYYRLLGFAAMICARNGVPSLVGQRARHNRMGWTDSPYTPEQQLANGIYMADLTTNLVNPFKERLVNTLQDQRLEPGIRGMFIRTRRGRIIDEQIYVESAVGMAIERLGRSSIICEQDPDLDRELSTIPFTGNEADTHTPHAVELFRNTVLPKLKRVTNGLLNADTVFVRS